MPNPLNIKRNSIDPVVVGCTGTGVAASAIFQKLFEVTGSPGLLVLALQNVVGSFSGLQFNVEFSATQSSPYWEVVGNWTPLTQGVGFFPITEAGFYRLNCTVFTDGTSVDVYATVGLPSGASSGGSGPSANVTLIGSTITLPVSVTGQPIDVNVLSGGGSNASVGLTGSPAPASATEVGFIDGSGNIVAPSSSAPLPVTVISGGGSPNVNLIEVGGSAIALGQTTMSASLPVVIASNQSSLPVTVGNFPATQPVSGTVAVSNFPATQPVSGTVTANAGTGTFLVDGSAHTQPISGAISFTAPQHVIVDSATLGTVVVSGTVTANQGGAPWSVSFPSAQHVIVDSAPTTSVTQGTSPWVVSLTSTTVTGTVAVTQSTSPWVVSGTVTANAGTGTFNTLDAADGTTGIAVPSKATYVGGIGVDGFLHGLSTDNSGVLNVNASFSAATIGAQNNGTSNASLATWTAATALNTTASILSNSFLYETVVISLSANASFGSGAITIEGSIDNSNWFSVPLVTPSRISSVVVVPQLGINPPVLATSTVTVTQANVAGIPYLRARLSTVINAGNVVIAYAAQSVTGNANASTVLLNDANGVGITSTNNGGKQSLDVNVSGGTLAVSGTVAVTQSTSPWAVSGTVTSNIGTTGGLALDATLTGGTQKTKLVDTGGTNVASISAGGALKVDGSAVTQPISGAISFTAPQHVIVDSATLGTVTVSGTVTTTPPSNASTNVTQWTGTAVDVNSGNKSAGTLRVVLATDQPQLTNALKVDGSGVTQPVSGAFWQATQPVSIAATVTTQDASDMTGTVPGTAPSFTGIVGGIYNSSAPTPTTGQTLPLQLDASGNLKVTGGSGGTQYVTGASTSSPTGTVAMAWDNTINQAVALKVNPSTRDLEVFVSGGFIRPSNIFGDSLYVITSPLYNPSTSVGTFNSASSLNAVVSLGGRACVAVQLIQTSTITGGAVTFEASADGTNWFAVPGYNPSTLSQATNNGVYTLAASTNIAFLFQVSALSLRARLSTVLTGTGSITFSVFPLSIPSPIQGSVTLDANSIGITSTLNSGKQSLDVNVSNAVAVSGTVAATQSGTWNIGTVTAVTAITNALPTGSNVIGHVITDSGSTTAVTGTVTVSGTVTANQGTSPWVVSLASTTVTGTVAVTQSGTWTVATNADGSLTGGAAGSKSLAVGGIYNTSAPTLTNGQQCGFQLDVNGLLKTTATFSGSIGTVNQGTANSAANSWPVLVTDGTNTLGVSAHPLRIDPTGTTSFQVGVNNTSLAVWNNATALNTTALILNGSFSYGTVLVELAQTTTLTAGAITFEGSINNSDWFTVQATNPATGAIISLPYTLVASTNTFFEIPVAALNFLRVRLSTAITGSGQVTVEYSAQSDTGQAVVTLSGVMPAPFNVSGLSTIGAVGINAGSNTIGNVNFVSGSNSVRLQDGSGNTISSNSNALNVNVNQINGNTTVTAATGVQKVGTVGSAGVAFDAAIAAGTAPTNGVAVIGQYNTTIPAPTAAQTVGLQVDQAASLYVNTEGRKKTYSCSASFTAAAGVIAYMPGNGTTTVRVLRVEVSLSTSGTAGFETISLIKTSAAPTGGTAASMTVVPHDSNFAAASSVPQNYTVAPTAGTPVGTIRAVQFADASATVGTASNTWLWDWGMRPGSAPVLRGTAQTLEINIGAVIATTTATVSYEWTEE